MVKPHKKKENSLIMSALGYYESDCRAIMNRSAAPVEGGTPWSSKGYM